jgi:hypothetical protein
MLSLQVLTRLVSPKSVDPIGIVMRPFSDLGRLASESNMV